MPATSTPRPLFAKDCELHCSAQGCLHRPDNHKPKHDPACQVSHRTRAAQITRLNWKVSACTQAIRPARERGRRSSRARCPCRPGASLMEIRRPSRKTRSHWAESRQLPVNFTGNCRFNCTRILDNYSTITSSNSQGDNNTTAIVECVYINKGTIVRVIVGYQDDFTIHCKELP